MGAAAGSELWDEKTGKPSPRTRKKRALELCMDLMSDTTFMNGSSSQHPSRILHVITRLDPGGSATNTLVSADGLRKRGFETALASGPTQDPEQRQARFLEKRHIPFFLLPSLGRKVSPVRDLKAYFELVRLLRQHPFDLVHTHTSKAGVLGRLAARRLRLPVVHTPHGHVFYGYFGHAMTRLFIGAEKALAPLTRRIISLTDIETQESLERGIGRREQYVTIPSGIPMARFRRRPGTAGSFRARQGIGPEEFLFVSLGRLTPVKGFDLLLRAFAQAAFTGPTRLVVVGDGEERAALEALARDLNVHKKVCFTGELEDPQPALEDGNAFVLASRNEGMGRAFIEAMAAGLPVIGPRTGGIPTFLHHEQTGLLVEPHDPPGLARAMERLEHNRALCHQLARAGEAFVYPAYDEETMLDQLADVYRNVLAEPSAPARKGTT